MLDSVQNVFEARVITANDLVEGDVVYLAAAGGWCRHLAEAQVFFEKDSADQALAGASKQTETVIAAYAVAVILTSNGPRPSHFREGFRMRGPSNRHHGKQSEPGFKA